MTNHTTTDTTDPTTTHTPALLPVCGARRTLPDHLVPVAHAHIPAGANATGDTEPARVERDLRCTLQAHTTGDHHAYAMHLPGADTGSLWVRWTHAHDPLALTVLPDCRTRAPEPLDETCCQYADHPGGHCYELTDPWHPTTQPAAATAAHSEDS